MTRYISANLRLALWGLLLIASVCLFCDSSAAIQKTMFTESIHEVSFNRYQAGFVCRERGWEFCIGWSYSHSRMA